jgi:ribosomal protein S2
MKKKEKKKEMKRENEKRSREVRVKLRRDTQFHRGGDQGQREEEMIPYVHSRRKGKVRRDRDQTVEQLGILLNRVEKRRKEDQKILVVGTSPELGRRRERRNREKEGKRKNRNYVTRGWVSGFLTNYAKYASRREVEETSRRVGKQDPSRKKGWKMVKEFPGLILFRHPNDHGVGRKEARRCGIPTAGIADSDCKYVDRRTYPIPGNDETREGQRRLRRRIRKLCQVEEGEGEEEKKE